VAGPRKDAEAPQQGETLIVPADVKRSDTMKENQAAEQETQTTQEPSEKKKLIKFLLEAENDEEVRRSTTIAVPDFPDHARLLSTVFTTTERPPDDLEDLNVPHTTTFNYSRSQHDCCEQFKTVGKVTVNTSTEFTHLPGL